MTTAFANGKFSLLHAGHFNLLTHCRHIVTYHGYVIVGIDSDERIKKNTSNDAWFSQELRAKTLRSLRVNNVPLIDTVHIFNTDQELYDLIKSVAPTYLVKGSDWQGKKVIGDDIPYVQMKFFPTEGYHSSDIVKLILEKHAQQGL